MEIRIEIELEGTETVCDVAGRLTGPAIAQLADACGSIEGHYVLDLSKLMFVNDAGAEVIRTLCERDAEIRGASSFIRMLIDDEPGYK
jgi:hypothetical protein